MKGINCGSGRTDEKPYTVTSFSFVFHSYFHPLNIATNQSSTGKIPFAHVFLVDPKSFKWHVLTKLLIHYSKKLQRIREQENLVIAKNIVPLIIRTCPKFARVLSPKITCQINFTKTANSCCDMLYLISQKRPTSTYQNGKQLFFIGNGEQLI